MSISEQEQSAVEAAPRQLFIGGEWRDASGGGERSRSRTRRPARRSARSPTRRPTTPRPRSTPPATRRPSGRASAPNERSEILYRAFEALTEQRRRARPADDARDGQVGRRVEGRDHLRGRVLPLVLGRGAADRRLLQDRRQRRLARAGDAPAGRALLLHHPLELPQRDGHAQDRPGDRRRLHDGRQAGAADAALDAGAGEAARRVRPARRASSTSSPAPRRARSRSRSSATRGCESSPSPARPRSAGS